MTQTLTVYANARERKWYPPKYTDSGYRMPGHWSMTYTELEMKPRCYVGVRGEGILSNLENRHRRPVDLYRSYIPAIKAAMHLTPEVAAKVKFNWSQRAGCSCGCSPGFIVSNLPTHLHFDMWVTVEATPETIADPTKPKRIIADPTLPFASEEAYA